MARIIVHEDAGVATLQVQSRRQSVCDSCTSYNKELDTCNECSCLVERKKMYIDDTCPLEKW